jgi:hypothetical protein
VGAGLSHDPVALRHLRKGTVIGIQGSIAEIV